MAIVPQAIAVEGIGYPPLSTATVGLVTPGSGVTYNVSVSDTLSVLDYRALDVEKYLRDAIVLYDEFGETGQEYQTTLSDTIFFTDSRSFDIEKYLATDSTPILDASYLDLDKVLATDAFGIADYRSLELDKALIDPASVLDAASTSADRAQALTDLATIFDSSALEQAKGLSDTLVTTDTPALEVAYSRSLTDAAPVTDYRSLQLDKGLADVAVVLDEAAADAQSSTTVFLSDSVFVTDYRMLDIDKGAYDAFSIVDTTDADTTREVNISVSDFVSMVDVRHLDIEKYLRDAVVSTEQVTRQSEQERFTADATAISDSKTLQLDKTLGDITSVDADSLSLARELGRALLDSVSLTERRELEVEKALVDAVGVLDSRSLQHDRATIDVGSTTESTATTLELGRVLSDIMQITDRRELYVEKNFTDTALLVDTQTIQHDRLLTDATATTDDTATTITSGRILIDVIAVTDRRELGIEKNLTDTSTVSDTRTLDVEKVFGDVVDVTDVVVAGAEQFRTLADTTSILDTRELHVDKLVRDVAITTDVAATALDYSLSESDTVTAGDVVETGYERYANVGDSTSLVDVTPEIVFDFSRSLVDSLVIDGVNTNASQFIRDASDACVPLDEVVVQVSDETDRLVGVAGNFDMYLPVGETGIVFVAFVPGVDTKRGIRHVSRVRRAVMLRAASTLAHWGVQNGDVIEFMREAAYLDRQVLAAMLGISEAQVERFETDVEEMPRLMFEALSVYVTGLDQRGPGTGFVLHPPEDRYRPVRIWPSIPVSNATYIVR